MDPIYMLFNDACPPAGGIIPLRQVFPKHPPADIRIIPGNLAMLLHKGWIHFPINYVPNIQYKSTDSINLQACSEGYTMVGLWLRRTDDQYILPEYREKLIELPPEIKQPVMYWPGL